MLFMALFPPCLATIIMVKVATRSYRWMLFAFAYPSILGMLVACLVYTGGGALGLSGWQAMWTFYGLALAVQPLFMGCAAGEGSHAQVTYTEFDKRSVFKR